MLLNGILVFDLSRLYPGPLCGQLLQDLGARVLKIEDISNGGDPTRYYPPFMTTTTTRNHDETDSSFIFHCFNREKHGIGLDFKKKENIELMKKMFVSDYNVTVVGNGGVESLGIGDGLKEFGNGVRVLIDSSRPGKLEQLLGVKSVEELMEKYPLLILCRISAFGQKIDKYSEIPAHDMNAVGSAGIFD